MNKKNKPLDDLSLFNNELDPEPTKIRVEKSFKSLNRLLNGYCSIVVLSFLLLLVSVGYKLTSQEPEKYYLTSHSGFSSQIYPCVSKEDCAAKSRALHEQE